MRIRPLWFGVIAAGLIGTPGAQTPISLPCARVDLVLIFDRSGSLRESHSQRLIEASILAFIETYRIDRENLQIGVTTFTAIDPDDATADPTARANARKAMPLVEITHDLEALRAAAGALPPAEGGTLIALGLRSAQGMFQRHLRANPDRADARKIAILFSDGLSNGKTQADDIAAADVLLTGGWSRGVLADRPDLSVPVTIHGMITGESETVREIIQTPTGRREWIQENQPVPYKYRILEKRKSGRRIKIFDDFPRPENEDDSPPTHKELREIDEVLWFVEEVVETAGDLRTIFEYDLPHMQRLALHGRVELFSYATLLRDLRDLNLCD